MSPRLPNILSFLLSLCVLASVTRAQQQEEDPYADEPYWYKPGHSKTPAEAKAISAPPGFVVEKILSLPDEMGSWTALCADPKGRIIAAAQHKSGLYRVTPPDPSDPASETKVERLQGAASTVGWSHGLLYAFDSLYITIAEGNETRKPGVYRLTDTDRDDQYDSIEFLFELTGTGEHGPHNMVVAPDGKRIYLMCGNGTPPPTTSLPTLPTAAKGTDRLMPPGFSSSDHTLSGFVLRFDPDGKNRQIVTSGLRNAYDLAFNRDGELFTFDSDMEWDLGTPWYRPTRICHLVAGGEFGWREGGAVWPEYYEDSCEPVLNIGPGSPTGMVFGYETNFPGQYKTALFVCDWTFATIHAVFLDPDGASYQGRFEEFVSGSGLPVTDIVAGDDGSLYFCVGGRRLGSAVYRIRYAGDEPSADLPSIQAPNGSVRTRHQLEQYIASPDLSQVSAIWTHLGSHDRAIRFAARVALEKLPVSAWNSKALSEKNPSTQLTALLALARRGSDQEATEALQALLRLKFQSLNRWQKLATLRAIELILGRENALATQEEQNLTSYLRNQHSNTEPDVSREILRLSSYLGDRSAIEPSLQRMAEDSGTRSEAGLSYYARNPKYGQAIRDMLESAPLVDRMAYAQNLLWVEDGWSVDQRERFFELIKDAATTSKGGHWYTDFWTRIRDAAREQINPDQLSQIDPNVFDFNLQNETFADLPKPIGPGRAWTVDEAMNTIEASTQTPNFEAGERAFAAASCITCHRIGTRGNAIGPDLSSIGQRFSTRDILTATIQPSDAVSDQYQMAVLRTKDGTVYSGRIVSRDSDAIRVATNQLRPHEITTIPVNEVESEQSLPVSTMPAGLLNSLNEDEVRDLIAYLKSSGDPQHPVYK